MGEGRGSRYCSKIKRIPRNYGVDCRFKNTNIDRRTDAHSSLFLCCFRSVDLTDVATAPPTTEKRITTEKTSSQPLTSPPTSKPPGNVKSWAGFTRACDKYIWSCGRHNNLLLAVQSLVRQLWPWTAEIRTEIRARSGQWEFGRLGTTYVDAIFAIFCVTSRLYVTTFIRHIKANSPACQQIYSSHKNWPFFLIYTSKYKLSHKKCLFKPGFRPEP